MQTRLELHSRLVELLGPAYSVYFQPPENVKITYPALVYERGSGHMRFADNCAYRLAMRYELVLISKNPDDPAIEKLLSLPYVKHERHFVSDLLNHDTYSLYW